MKLKNKLLTIIVPTYNMASYLDNCLNSFVKESDEDLEVLIINDGSTDMSVEVAMIYVKKFPNLFRLVNKVNGGHGSCINMGISLAKGKYFKVVDADDWLINQSLSKHISFLKKNDCDLIITNYQRKNENGITENIIYPLIENLNYNWKKLSSILNRKDFLGYFHMHSITYKKTILEKLINLCTENCFYVDQEYIFKPMLNVKSIFYQNIFLYQYRIGRKDQSISEEKMIERFNDHVLIYHSLTSFFFNASFINIYQKQYFINILWHHLNTLIYISVKKHVSLKNIFYFLKTWKNIDINEYFIFLNMIIKMGTQNLKFYFFQFFSFKNLKFVIEYLFFKIKKL